MKRILIAFTLVSVGLIGYNRELGRGAAHDKPSRQSVLRGGDLEAGFMELDEIFVISSQSSLLPFGISLPSIGSDFLSEFEIKDISINIVDNIARAVGTGSMFFIRKF